MTIPTDVELELQWYLGGAAEADMGVRSVQGAPSPRPVPDLGRVGGRLAGPMASRGRHWAAMGKVGLWVRGRGKSEIGRAHV